MQVRTHELPNDLRFQMWMARVDASIQLRSGLTSSDLQDEPYRDWFNDRMNARVAAGRVLRNAGWVRQ